MGLDYFLSIRADDKISKSIKRLDKRLLKLSKTALKSTRKINNAFKKINLKHTLIIDTKKTMVSLTKVDKKLKKMQERSKKFSLGKFAVGAGVGAGAFGFLNSALDTTLEREATLKKIKKASNFNRKEMKRLRVQREGTGAYRKTPYAGMYIGSSKDVGEIQTQVLKMGFKDINTVLTMTRHLVVGAQAWDMDNTELVKTSGKILSAFNIGEKNAVKSAKQLLNSINHLADTFKNVYEKDVTNVAGRISGTTSNLGFGILETSALSAMLSDISTSPELAASGFQAFMRDLTKLPDLLDLKNPIIDQIKNAKTQEERMSALSRIIGNFADSNRYKPALLLKMFGDEAVKFLTNFWAKGGPKKLLDFYGTKQGVRSDKSKKSIEKERKIVSTGVQAEINILKQSWENFKERLFKVMLPTFRLIVWYLTKLLAWAGQNIAYIKKAVLILGGVLMALTIGKFLKKLGGGAGGASKRGGGILKTLLKVATGALLGGFAVTALSNLLSGGGSKDKKKEGGHAYYRMPKSQLWDWIKHLQKKTMYTVQGPHTKSLKKALEIFEKRFGKGSFDSNKKPTSKVENLTGKMSKNNIVSVNNSTKGGTNEQGSSNKKLVNAFTKFDSNAKEKIDAHDKAIKKADDFAEKVNSIKMKEGIDKAVEELKAIKKNYLESQKNTRQDLVPKLT